MRISAFLLASALFLSSVDEAFSQGCNPNRVQLELAGGSLTDIQAGAKSAPFRVFSGADPFTARWDEKVSRFIVDLQGVTITFAQFTALRLGLDGFRLAAVPRGARSQQTTASECTGYFQFEASRVWRVHVSVSGSNDQILVEVEGAQPSGGPVKTPIVVPVGPADVAPLDWATPLTLTVYPIPNGRPDQRYTVPLSADALNRSECGGAASKRLCHDKNEILSKLPKPSRFSVASADLARTRAVVPRIQFQLQP